MYVSTPGLGDISERSLGSASKQPGFSSSIVNLDNNAVDEGPSQVDNTCASCVKNLTENISRPCSVAKAHLNSSELLDNIVNTQQGVAL